MNRWTCEQTGLSVLEGPVTMFRVSSDAPNRGPLRPIPRPKTERADRGGWSRFDVGERADLDWPGLTIYGATRRDTAFTEVMAWKAATSATFAGLVNEANFTGTSIDVLFDDLYGRGIPVGGVDLEWRKSRRIYTLETWEALWIDLFHRDSVSAIRGLVGQEIVDDLLSISTIIGVDRSVTTRIAESV